MRMISWLRLPGFRELDPDVSKADGVPVRFRGMERVAIWRSFYGELHRGLRPGGIVAFEVGEVPMRETIGGGRLAGGVTAGLDRCCGDIMKKKIRSLPKTANCWGVNNNFKGTNTIVLWSF